MLTRCREKWQSHSAVLNQNSLCQLIVDAVSAVLDRDGTALSSFFDNGDRLAAVTAEREEEGVELLVVGLDFFDYIFVYYIFAT